MEKRIYLFQCSSHITVGNPHSPSVQYRHLVFHTSISLCVWLYVCMYVCLYVCMHECMCVSVYVYTHAHTQIITLSAPLY